MKALLHLKDGKNETVELLIDISEKLGDIQEFVNAAYTNSYYKGELKSGSLKWANGASKNCSPCFHLTAFTFKCHIEVKTDL